MDRRGISKILMVFLGFILVVSSIHTFAHFSFFGTGVDGFYKSGVSGFAIGNINIDESMKDRFDFFSSYSKLLLIAEWTIVLLLCSLALLRHRTIIPLKSVEVIKEVKKDNSKINTDLDTLYAMLKKKKKIKISEIANYFGIDKEKVMDWCNILESGNLATLRYPKFGEPELIMIESNLIKDE
jgi:hypothetical protein